MLRRLLLWFFLFLRLRPRLRLGLRLWPRLDLWLRARLRLGRRLHPGRCLRLRPRLDLGLRPRGYLRLWPRLRLRFWPRLDPGRRLGLRARLRLRPGLHLRPRLHLGLRAHLRFYLRRCLGLGLGLAGGAAGLRGPWSNRGGGRPRPDPGMEFSRFSPADWWDAWLNLSRLGLGARLDLPRLYWYARLHLSRSGMSPRLGCGCRGKRLGFARHKLLLGRQLLNLLGHLGSQGHGGLGGQRRARQAPSRLQRHGLDPGNSGGEPGHIFGGRHEIGPVQVNLGHSDIWRQPGWR